MPASRIYFVRNNSPLVPAGGTKGTTRGVQRNIVLWVVLLPRVFFPRARLSWQKPEQNFASPVRLPPIHPPSTQNFFGNCWLKQWKKFEMKIKLPQGLNLWLLSFFPPHWNESSLIPCQHTPRGWPEKNHPGNAFLLQGIRRNVSFRGKIEGCEMLVIWKSVLGGSSLSPQKSCLHVERHCPYQADHWNEVLCTRLE